MLLGISPLLNADVLHCLASMGHGDELVICDANFPAKSVSSQTVLGTHLEVSADAISVLKAILTVVPIDTFDAHVPAVRGMQVVDAPDEIPEFISDASLITKACGSEISLVERYAFYEQAKNSYAVIRSIETRLYGNLILRKGVIQA